jgi:hypothetical protein
MNFFNKETLIDAAALGGGVVAGRSLVNIARNQKLADKLKLSEETGEMVLNALPIAGGIATLMLGKGNRIATGLANGMFASSFAYYVDYALQKALGTKYQPTITGDVMMNGVMMNGVDDGSGVLMGAAEDLPNYSSSSYDFTYADAGELDY